MGRSSFGRFTHLCSSPASYGKVLNLIRKDVEFFKMLTEEREKLMGLTESPKEILDKPSQLFFEF